MGFCVARVVLTQNSSQSSPLPRIKLVISQKAWYVTTCGRGMVLGWGEILVVVGEIRCAFKSWCRRSHCWWMNLSRLSPILRSLTLQWCLYWKNARANLNARICPLTHGSVDRAHQAESVGKNSSFSILISIRRSLNL